MNNAYKEKFLKSAMTRKSIYSTDIALVSSIIHDGVKNKDELIRKYAAITNQSYKEAETLVNGLEEREELGFYKNITFKEVPDTAYLFEIWKGDKPAFPPNDFYKKGEEYFKSFFRKKASTS